MKREGKKTPTGELSSLPIGDGKFSYKVRGREAPTRESSFFFYPKTKKKNNNNNKRKEGEAYMAVSKNGFGSR